MKLEIKSVLIGLLLGINIMLLMGSAPANKEVGRYAATSMDGWDEIYIIDTTNGGIISKSKRREIRTLLMLKD